MRIISSFHDFYDAVMKTGMDSSLLYIREPKKIEFDQYNYPFRTWSNFWDSTPGLLVSSKCVGFCGKFYPILEITDWSNNRQEHVSKLCYSMEDVDKFVGSIASKKQLEEYHYKGKALYKYNRFCNRSKFASYFREFEESIQPYHRNYFTYERPLFVASQHDYTLTFNANLKSVDFFRVMDPFQTFQELAMYLGSLATPLRPIKEMDDATKIAAHGFNKYSFRKDKSV